MSEPRHITDVLGALVAGIADPRRLKLSSVSLPAYLAISWARAKDGLPNDTGDMIALGTEQEVKAILRLISGNGNDTIYAVRYNAHSDQTSVEALVDFQERARIIFSTGNPDSDLGAVVFVGPRHEAEARATLLRRIRAGRRGQKGDAL